MQPNFRGLLEHRVACSLPRLLEACKDIQTPEILFNVLPIIAEGHSMNLRRDILKGPTVEVFDDLDATIGFLVLHGQSSYEPHAIQIFMAGFIGHFLKLKNKQGGDLCMARLLTEVHIRTQSLRSMPIGTKVPNGDRLQLFTAVLEVLFCTIPLARCPVGFGGRLDPARITDGRPVREMLNGIEQLVDGILTAHV
ncbi:hypothetical protein DL96DRAFT_1818019 [Flagelloscypha sp. PMI_526]|nr:hypothetical protein DL96DRAFT_1818019 [Flagelloscypha sp. PMI_526]